MRSITKNELYLITIFIIVIAIEVNVNALVDMVFHHSIPYFHEEHIIVGGISGLITIILMLILFRYYRKYERAKKQIQVLESVLPICSNCNKIRLEGKDPKRNSSWMQIESYIKNTTDTEFTHSICPDCIKELYPFMNEETPGNEEKT